MTDTTGSEQPARLGHDVVARPAGLLVDDRDAVYFSMKLVRGEDFRRILDRIVAGRIGATAAAVG